jgi:hypothetical protein
MEGLGPTLALSARADPVGGYSALVLGAQTRGLCGRDDCELRANPTTSFTSQPGAAPPGAPSDCACPTEESALTSKDSQIYESETHRFDAYIKSLGEARDKEIPIHPLVKEKVHLVSNEGLWHK